MTKNISEKYTYKDLIHCSERTLHNDTLVSYRTFQA